MRSNRALGLAAGTFLAVHAMAQEAPFPLAETVARARQTALSARAQPSGLTREDYLKVSEGIVGYFRHFQTPGGRIIDPFLDREVQYSTPCYAWAATALVDSGRQTNLLESATRALDAALDELAEGRTADNHSDFFTFPCVLAFEGLRDRVTPPRREQWERKLRAIVPERVYQDAAAKGDPHNWNIVALAGEFLRQQDGFGDPTFVENSLALQLKKNFTANGQYLDPGAPLAYDHFPRCFLAVMIERGYRGAHYDALTNLLDRAAWTSLLLQSPRGEWPAGGRSGQHQWNEAMQCVTYEIWAGRKEREGDPAGAQMFKRAARLALESVRRWLRPSGELWIVKNYFDPAARHGFQSYSFHSQYNLLAASLLATAWRCADDGIREGVCPAQAGGFALQLPEFHKVVANAGGLYVELDTAADPAYDSTGLTRIHKTGVDSLLGPSDSAAIKDGPAAVGVAWREGDQWQSLAGQGEKKIERTEFSVQQAEATRVRFKVRYVVQRSAVAAVAETYDVTPERVTVTAEVEGNVAEIKAQFPALAFDGTNANRITIDGATVSVQSKSAREVFSVESPAGVRLARGGAWISCRNGFFEMIGGVAAGRRVVFSLTPAASE